MPEVVEKLLFDTLEGDNSSTASSDEKKTKANASKARAAKGSAWIDPFLSALMQGSSVREATKLAGVDMTLPYKRRKTDPAFKLAWQEAADVGTEFLEQEVARRAYHGTLKPIFHKGVECGHSREYSDILLMFLLKARNPAKYRDHVENGTPTPAAMNINVVVVDSKPAAQLIEMTADSKLATQLIEVTALDDSDRQDRESLPEAGAIPPE